VEDLNQALIECVKAAGGSQNVGRKLFPEKTPEAAQRAVLDCLNPDRPAKFSPEQMLLVLRLARDVGYHGGINYILADLCYEPTKPADPKDEIADLLRQFEDAMGAADRLAGRLEKLRPALEMRRHSNLRSAA
jgi:hypothetical protein